MEEILKYLVLIFGILDSFKYHLLAKKMMQLKSSREISRKFSLIGLAYRTLLLFYAYYYLNDWVIPISCIIALYTLGETMYYSYEYYPYRRRGLKNFKKPSFTKFLIHILIPNKYHKKPL